MTVTGCAIGGNIMTVEEGKQRLASDKITANQTKTISPMSHLSAMAALCNGAELDAAAADVPVSERKVFGDATDTAIIRFSEILEAGNVAYYRSCWRKDYELAFNSKNKFMIRCFTNNRQEAVDNTLPKEAASAFKPTDT